MKKILVLNTGSSSIKFAFFENNLKIYSGNVDKVKDYSKAVNEILEILKKENLEFDVIAHRVVHGGQINKSCLINSKIEKIIKEYSQFAPLHNIPQLKVINLCKKLGKKQYAIFDTAFFNDLPEKASRYPIPKEITKKFGIKRYGFHGISHKYVSQNFKGKTIVCHLGSGCSVSAIQDGKPIDTSMGLTPLEGLMMGTRAGDIDPGIIIFLEKKGYDMNEILNFKSGLKAFSKDNDFRYFLKNLDKKEIKLGFDIFIYRILKYIGAYSAALNGLDNLIFTGAIGENSETARREICKNLTYLGLEIDNNKNKKNQEIISTLSSKVKVYIKKTDEEREIAKEVYKII